MNIHFSVVYNVACKVYLMLGLNIQIKLDSTGQLNLILLELYI